VLGPGHWLIARGVLAQPALAPFAAMLDTWLGRHNAAAVLVRPDHYVYGTGDPARLAAQWEAAAKPAIAP